MPYDVLDPSTAAAAPTTTAGNPLTSVGETLSSMQTELGQALGNRDDTTAAMTARWINWAYQNVCGMVDLKETYGSVGLTLATAGGASNGGQNFYLVPVQVSWIKRISVIDTDDYAVYGGRELEMIDEAEYRTLPNEIEEPRAYFRWRRMVVIWPTPVAVRTCSLDFKVRPNDLVAATDSPLLPIEFHEPILLSAISRAWRSLLNPTNAALAMNDFLGAIRPLQNTDAMESEGRNGVVAPVRSREQLFRKGSMGWRTRYL